MSQRTLNWPRRIARADRTPLSPGHGSFCLQRVHLGDDAFDRQRIRLAGYLIVLVREGSVILDRGQHSILLHEGDAALVPAGEFAMTEIPRWQFSRGVAVFYFFNQRALADLISSREGIDEIAARISLPALPFYPVQCLGAALEAVTAIDSLAPLADLRAVFTGLLATRPAMTLTFLKHQLFVQRFRLCIFLEGHCMGKVDLKHIASRYTDGVAAFRRDCASYLGLPVEQWFFRRRTELAQWRLRHTNRVEQEVAARLGYTDMRRFRGDMKRFGRFSPLELETLRFLHPQKSTAQSQVPFWFPDSEARAAKTRRLACDLITICTSAPKPSNQKALLRRYVWQPEPAWTPDISQPLAHQMAGEVETSSAQEDIPDNIIFLDSVEAWQAGRSALSLALTPVAVAA